jgi:beta-phosphoglucomutase|tara:strand:- start:676 stop:1377 length:702 start_codon:yes stop_codon:yes gene_type:complete
MFSTFIAPIILHCVKDTLIKSKAVLFDFDGTLADTMRDHYAAWEKASLDYGIKLNPEDYYPLEGTNVFEIAKRLFKINQISSDEKELVQKKEKYYLDKYTINIYPGVEYLINKLRSYKIKLGIVTTGLRKRIFSSVPKQFLDMFDVIICGDDTVKGKPFPDPYLKGMKKLILKPKECIIVENSPIGVESAKATGAYCIAICSTLGDEYFTKADVIFNSFEVMSRSDVFDHMLG